MRKVTEAACAAFESGTDWAQGNTEVRTNALIPRDLPIGTNAPAGSCTCMYLHGNPIAVRRQNGELWLSTGGYTDARGRASNTTLNRLNGLPGVYVHYDKGELILHAGVESDWNWDGAWRLAA